MRYRVKEEVYGDGRRIFYPQCRIFLFWTSLDEDFLGGFPTLDEAIEYMNKHRRIRTRIHVNS